MVGSKASKHREGDRVRPKKQYKETSREIVAMRITRCD